MHLVVSQGLVFTRQAIVYDHAVAVRGKEMLAEVRIVQTLVKSYAAYQRGAAV